MPNIAPRCIPCPALSPECPPCASGETCYLVPASCSACASAACGPNASVSAATALPIQSTWTGFLVPTVTISNPSMPAIPTESGMTPVPTLRSYTTWPGTGLGPLSPTSTWTGRGTWSSDTWSSDTWSSDTWSSGTWNSMHGPEWSMSSMNGSDMSMSTVSPSTTGGGGPIATLISSSTGSASLSATAVVAPLTATASVLSATVPSATVLALTTSSSTIATAGAGAMGVDNSLGALVLLLIAMFVR